MHLKMLETDKKSVLLLNHQILNLQKYLQPVVQLCFKKNQTNAYELIVFNNFMVCTCCSETTTSDLQRMDSGGFFLLH